MLRCLVISMVAAFGLALSTEAQPARPYVIKKDDNGRLYLGSDVFIRRSPLDLSQYSLDQALEISSTAVRHAATGLTLPRIEGDCTLEWISGLPAGEFRTFERGGRAYYVCDEGAPSFIVLSFESEMPGFSGLGDDPARALIAAGMVLQRDPGRLSCDDGEEGESRRVACRTDSEWVGGVDVSELGLFIGAENSFVKLNAACLPDRCDAAQARLDRLARTMRGQGGQSQDPSVSPAQ